MDKVAILEKELSDTREELEKARKIAEADKAATDLRENYEAFLRAGFTEEQAWELFTNMIKLAWNVTKR